MIRRPLSGMAVFLVLGMLCYTMNFGLLIVFAAGMAVFLSWPKAYGRFALQFTKEDWHRWMWPVFFLIGALSMSDARQESILETTLKERPMSSLQATILDIRAKENTNMLLVGHIRVYDDSKKIWYEDENAVIYTKSNQKFAIGNRILVNGDIQGLSKATNPGQFDEYSYYRIKGVVCKAYSDEITITDTNTALFRNAMYRLRLRMTKQLTKLLCVRQAGLLSAILFGDKELLMDEVMELYRENGLAHIMAVSGLHVSLLGYGLYRLLKKLTVPHLISAGISVTLLLGYGAMAGYSVSTKRALIMFSLMMGSVVIGRSYDMLSGLSLAVILILLQQPLEITDAAFLFSFGAVLGIAVLAPQLKKRLIENRKHTLSKQKKKILEAFLASFSAQLTTLPLNCYFYFEISFYSIFVNLLILPLRSLLVFTSLIACLLSFVNEWLGVFCIGMAHYLLQLFELILRIPEYLPYHLILIGRPAEGYMAAYYLVLYGVYRLNMLSKSAKSLSLLSILILFLQVRQPSGMFVHFLDVSQGDCAILCWNGKVFLIDGGSSNVNQVYEYRIKPFLKSKGIRHIDLVAVSHADIDHVSGVIECLEQMKHKNSTMMDYSGELTIGTILLPKLSAYDENYQKIIHLAEDKRILSYGMGQGDVYEFSGLKLSALAPKPDIPIDNRNNTSLVLLAECGEFEGLFLGDIDGTVEKEILAHSYQELLVRNIDVLKVAHHGSKNSSTREFVETVHPDLAVICAGENNRFGHPHPMILERYQEVGIPVLVTKKDGYIMRRYHCGEYR